ncbi:DUF1573 domain-containing protein [Chitinophaga sp. 30R24]|uniref:DUF1573 domain-containing protein n=1 Tax=Chitinophaga sp. 30R24 TaxID=3248838 RepID=UPI003B901685
MSTVFAEAKKNNKKVFLLISDEKCGKCNSFVNFLNTQKSTVAILQDQYIACKIDMSNPQQKEAGQILKCPSFPFPYFFDADGNLEAFGFPNSPKYDIRDLSKIFIEEDRFHELFLLPISIPVYKKMVSAALKSYLLLNNASSGKDDIEKGYAIAKQSMSFGVYPYNLYLGYRFTAKLGLDSANTAYIAQIKDNYTLNDSYLYMSLFDKYGIDHQANTGKHSAQDLIFNPDTIAGAKVKFKNDYFFSYEFINQGTDPITIRKAEHACSCVQLNWPRYPVKPNEKGKITGVFHATEKGTFSKDIYVHSNSKYEPMRILSLQGEVYE